MFRRGLILVAIAACGGDDGMNTQVDARAVDAVASTVMEIGCPASPAGDVTVNLGGTAYVPMQTTIQVNGIVRFTMPADHNVVPNTLTTTDPGLTVPFNTTKCLRFTTAGTFGFNCGPHGFAGTIVVQ